MRRNRFPPPPLAAGDFVSHAGGARRSLTDNYSEENMKKNLRESLNLEWQKCSEKNHHITTTREGLGFVRLTKLVF